MRRARNPFRPLFFHFYLAGFSICPSRQKVAKNFICWSFFARLTLALLSRPHHQSSCSHPTRGGLSFKLSNAFHRQLFPIRGSRFSQFREAQNANSANCFPLLLGYVSCGVPRTFSAVLACTFLCQPLWWFFFVFFYCLREENFFLARRRFPASPATPHQPRLTWFLAFTTENLSH